MYQIKLIKNDTFLARLSFALIFYKIRQDSSLKFYGYSRYKTLLKRN